MMDLTAAGLSSLVSTGETESIEFKASFNDEAVESIGAFANASGGVVLIGVRDSGEVCGFVDGKKTLEDIANRIQLATEPRLQPSIFIVNYEDQNILVIQVAENIGGPVSVRGRYWKRSGRTNQRMSHEEIMQRMANANGFSWDAFPMVGMTIDDLDNELLDRFVRVVKEKKRIPAPDGVTIEELLHKCELMKDGVPTRAAILLFGKNPNSFFESAFLKLGRFRSPTLIVDDREVHGALIRQLDGAMGWFRERLETEFVITGKPERDVIWEYPLDAIREAVTNILTHRDYTSGANSQIRLYDDHVYFSNAGGLISPLTPEALFKKHDSIRRNRKIAKAFFYMGLIERWGSGTIRIAEYLKNARHPKPEFISTSGRFEATFYRKAEEVTQKNSKSVELTERQLQLVKYLEDNETISSVEYQELLGVSRRTASREFSELLSKGIIAAKGKGPSRVYCLKR